MLIVVWGLGKS